MTTMENPQPDTSDPGNELTAEAAEHAEIFPTDIGAENEHLERAYKLQEEGDFEAALQECTQAIADVPTLAEAHNLQGILLEQAGRPEQALEAYRRAVEVDAEFEEARQNLRELQEELREASGPQTKVNPLKVILTGAGVYGILHFIANDSLLFLSDIEALIIERFQILPFARSSNVVYGIEACALGVGAFIIGKVARFKQALWLGIGSGLGFVGACMLTGFYGFEPSLLSILRCTFIGAVTGFGFGLVQETSGQIGLSTIAGIVGLDIYFLLTSRYLKWVRFK